MTYAEFYENKGFDLSKFRCISGGSGAVEIWYKDKLYSVTYDAFCESSEDLKRFLHRWFNKQITYPLD